MKTVRFATLLTALALTPCAWAHAQETPPAASGGHGFSFVAGLDDLGRTILGKRNPPAARQATPPSASSPAARQDMPQPRSDSSATLTPDAVADQDRPLPHSLRRQTEPEFTSTSPETPLTAQPNSDIAPARGDEATASATGPVVTAPNGAAPWMARPIYERINTLRQSAFDGDSSNATAPSDADRASPPVAQQAVAASPAATATAPQSSERRPPWTGTPTLARRSLVPYEPARTAIERTVPQEPATTADARSSAPLPDNANVLIARKGPALSVETLGPRKIVVGRESSYQLTINNSGEVAADEVVVFIDLPPWAEVLGAEASVGSTQLGAPGDASKPFLWKIGQLGAMGKERLTLRIVPRESKPFDLGVRWDYRPVATQTMIEVQEPKLAMRLDGPREVAYGKKELFTLALSNSGNGDAENVAITLVPVGAGDNQPATHQLGSIAAGGQKSVEIELTARQSGDLLIQVEARAEGGVGARLAEKVLVRRGALQLAAEGPQVQFVGVPATYRMVVVNPGNAPVRNLNFTASLPPGAKYLGGIEGAAGAGSGARVQWTLAALGIGEQREFNLQCALGMPGSNRVDVTAVAEDDLNAAGTATTDVEAVADLMLNVRDPSGPVAVGQEAVYEIVIRNRGTKAAEGVEVMAFFSDGVEPVAAEGGLNRMQPGQVVFNPIASIAPGSETAIKIRAVAQTPGTHIFRCEVHCKPLGIRRVNEISTQFYQQGMGLASGMMQARTLPTSTTPAGTMPASMLQADRRGAVDGLPTGRIAEGANATGALSQEAPNGFPGAGASLPAATQGGNATPRPTQAYGQPTPARREPTPARRDTSALGPGPVIQR